MYLDYWGFSASPFPQLVEPTSFYEGPTHEECLARLFYSIEERHPVGLLTGPAGTGKSLLLNVLREETLASGRRCLLVRLAGVDADEFLWELAVQLGIGPSGADSRRVLWRRLEDALSGLRLAGIPVVVLLDEWDEAHPETLQVIRRLLDREATVPQGMTCLLAGREPGRTPQHARIGELTHLRVELTPWDWRETGEFLVDRMMRAGAKQSVFSAEAIERIHEYAQGIPRTISQIADLALLAGVVEEAKLIEPAIIDAVARELPTTVPVAQPTAVV